MKDPYHHHPHHYHRHNNSLQPPSEEEQESAASWVIDKPRRTVAWSKFAASCFCFPGFQQLAHRAGRSMSGLRDDGIYDSLYNKGNIIYDEQNAHHHHHHHHNHNQEPQTTGVVSSRDDEDENDSRYIPPPPPPIRLHEASRLFHTNHNHNHHYNHHYHHHNTSIYGGSIVSDMTESELSSCCLSLSEHTSSHKSGSNEDEHNDEGSHEMIATKSWRMMDASLPPLPPPPQAPTSRRNLSNANSNSTSNGSIPSLSHNHKTRAVAAPGKPPVSPHRPPQAPSISLWGATATATAAAPTSGSSCNSYHSTNNRSFVTTGSFFSTTSSAASSSFIIPHSNVNVNNNSTHGSRNRSFTGDSSSSITSFHRRQSPILTVPTKEHPELSSQLPAAPNLSLPLPPPPPPPLLPSPRSQQQQQFVVVGGGRNRLDSEVSALEMGSEHGCDDNDDDDENDSVVNSPFPLLELKGDERKHFQPQDSPPPPPPPPSIPRISPRRLFPNSPKWGKSKSPKHSKKEAGTLLHKRRRRGSRPSSHKHKRPSLAANHEPTNFLCKNTILENSPLLPILDESARMSVRRRVVVSGWIVVLFGNKPQRTPSFPGFGAKDLYYLRIVEESTACISTAATASLVLYWSTDGRQAYVFPIEQQWIIESSERKDRRVGRSISILRTSPNNSNKTAAAAGDSLCGWMEMIPVALHESWRAKLDQRIQDATATAVDSRDAAGSTDCRSSHINGSDENHGGHLTATKEAISGSESTFVILPQPGRFAPDAQLDTARHLFFTIDSFAKQQR